MTGRGEGLRGGEETNVVSAESDVCDASEDQAQILRRDLAVTGESSGFDDYRGRYGGSDKRSPSCFDIYNKERQLTIC